MDPGGKEHPSTTIDNQSVKSLSFDTNFIIFEQIVKRGHEVANKCHGKDLVFLLGALGSGKSVLFNYLAGIPMREFTPKEKGIKASILDRVVDVVEMESYAAIIGHGNESATLIPQIHSINSDDLLCCDCPGFLDNRGVEISIANAVNIRNILYAARSVKVILLVEFASLLTGRQALVAAVDKIARNLFGSGEDLVQHADSILLGVTKIPKSSDKQSLDELKGVIEESVGGVIPRLADKLFLFDPVDQGDLKYEPVLNRIQLIERIRELSTIINCRDVFCTSITPEDKVELENIFQKLDAQIQECIANEDLLMASKHFQKLKSLEVMKHPLIDSAMERIRKNVKNIQNKIILETQLNMEKGDLDRTEELLVDLAKLVQTFEDKECDEELGKLEVKYKDKKWWRVVKTSAVVAGVATTVIVGASAAIIAAPIIPIEIVGGVLIAGAAGSTELGIVAGVTKIFTDKIKKFSAKEKVGCDKVDLMRTQMTQPDE